MKTLFNHLRTIGILIVCVYGFVNCQQKQVTQGTIIKLVGNATAKSATESRTLSVGDKVAIGETLITDQGAALVLGISPGGVTVELQENGEFSIAAFDANKKELDLKRGNAWFQADGKALNGELRVVTPTAIAGVRGTKFYSFELAGIQGMCHCEGEVDYEVKDSTYKSHHEQDYLTLTKDGKTLLLTPEDLRATFGGHKHSVFDDSSIGPKAELNEEKVKEIIGFIDKKFKEAK